MLPELLATPIFTTVVLSAVIDVEVSVIFGAKLYAVNAPEELPVPDAFVTAMVPEALPIGVTKVIELSLITLNVSTGDPPIVTRVVPVK